MNKILSTQEENDTSTASGASIELRTRGCRVRPSRRHPWTRIHSHYALMGGFVCDIGDTSPQKRFFPGRRTRVTISPDGLLFLAEVCPLIIPDLDEAEIKDKDKAGGFSWFTFVVFLGQGCYLAARNLPISVMEYISMAYAFNGLLTSLIWWEKPLNVNQPTLIQDHSLHGLFAYMCFHSTFEDSDDLQYLAKHMPIVAEPSAGGSLPCFDNGKHQSKASPISGGVTWNNSRRYPALCYERNSRREDLWFQ